MGNNVNFMWVVCRNPNNGNIENHFVGFKQGYSPEVSFVEDAKKRIAEKYYGCNSADIKVVSSEFLSSDEVTFTSTVKRIA